MNMSTRSRILCTAVTALVLQYVAAAAVPDFKTDQAADAWLRQASATYARVVREIAARKNVRGHRFVTRKDVPVGMATRVGDMMEIQLNPRLTGPRRVSTLMFEMANASRFDAHEAIDLAVDRGLITTPEEFGLAHEIYEYEALRIHRRMLIEIAATHGPLPKAFFYLVTPAPRSAADYRLPNLYTYLKTQKDSGHTAHYHKHFRLRTARRRRQAKKTGR